MGISGHHSEELGSQELLPALRLVALMRETETEKCSEELMEQARSEFGLQPDAIRGQMQEAWECAHELGRALG